MAIGDDAANAGYQLVPTTGEDGKVKYGAREINRTRDYVANVKSYIEAVKALIPADKGAYQWRCGISYGTNNPSGGTDGDIYFKIV